MAHNSRLYRNFIILQEDEKKHTTSSDKVLSGYAKIEAKSEKCKITFYAQNLSKDDKYSIVLICYKKDVKQIVQIGSLDVSEIGKGEACKEYYINNIAGLDLSYEKISGAGICKHTESGLSFIMYGFMNGENVEDDWKKCKVVKATEAAEKKPQEEKKPEKKPQEEKKPEKKCDCEKDSKDHAYKKKDEEKKKDECNVGKSHKEKDCMDYCDKDHDHDNRFDQYEKSIEANKDFDIDPYDFNLRGKVGDFFEDIAKGFEEVKNKFKEIKYCKWFKVKVKNIDDLCDVSNYNKYTIAFYPMLNYYPYIKKYGYFIFGYKCDSKGNLKYIVYGIPGKKDVDEQPYMGKTGFVTWVKGNKEDEGCWLMFYDYKKSTVVVPTK